MHPPEKKGQEYIFEGMRKENMTEIHPRMTTSRYHHLRMIQTKALLGIVGKNPASL